MSLQRFGVHIALFVSFSSLAISQIGVGSGLSLSMCVTGIPYSAQRITTQVQVLTDGTRITHTSKQVFARDSQGRIRDEIYFSKETAAGTSDTYLAAVTIMDPIAHQLLHLDPLKKQALIHILPAATPRQPAVTPSGAGNSVQTPHPATQTLAGTHRQQTVEKLPGQVIEGLYAEGKRITEVIPAGTTGNDRDITVVTENWYSPELKISVLNKRTDPRMGELTDEIKDLSREEPAPDLFQIPADYAVQPNGPSRN